MSQPLIILPKQEYIIIILSGVVVILMEKFNLTYNWFNEKICESVHKVLNCYFENNFDVMLASISCLDDLKSNPILKNELFYSCRIPIKNKQFATLRVSSDFIRIIFHDSFGSNLPVFDLEKLTELEQLILNTFFENTVKSLDNFLIKDSELSKINPLNKSNLNFTFLIKNADTLCGKLGLTVPSNRLLPQEIKLQNNFTFEDFEFNAAYIDIVCGYSRISLNDLKTLSRGDILVLEKSNAKIMTLKTETVVKDFIVNPKTSIMLDVEDDLQEEINSYKDDIMSDTKTMWDDIQIEISAEFKRVKMSLGELKQISKGQVIDLGSIMNNEISLLVENKAVAKGELVIINDKYGVKIDKVFATQKPDESDALSKNPEPVVQPKSQQAGSIPNKPQPVPPSKPGLQKTPPLKPAAPVQPKAPQQTVSIPKKPPLPNANQAAAKPAPPKAQQSKDDFDYSNFEE